MTAPKGRSIARAAPLLTVGGLLERWLAADQPWKPSTRVGYQSNVRFLRGDPLADVRVLALTPHRARDALARWGSAGASLAVRGGDVHVDLALDSTHSAGTARGTVGGVDVAVTWTNSESTPADPDIQTAVDGAVGLGRVALQGLFRGAFMFDEASVEGELAGKHLAVKVVRAAGGWTSDTVGVTGRIGETEFMLYAAVQVGSWRGRVRGSIGAEPVHLDARAGDSSRSVHVSGSFPGPPELVVLTVAALRYFL